MGVAEHLEVAGAKGGSSKPKTPVEAPDSLQSTNIASILLAVGEGEFDGTPTDRDIYLDNTPIMDAGGNVNFPGVKWEWRPGSVEQDYIQGIPAIENETTVNVELRSDNPFSRALSNTQLSAVRVRMSWPRLVQQDSSGNTNGYRIEYAIDVATDGGAYVEAHLGAVDGKTTNGYQRSVRVNLPAATSGWMLRVRRITPNANSGTIADTMTIAGYTEIIDEKLRYPNTALLYIEFDAQQFQNIPSVTVKCKARRWPVPSNYDPVGRTYSGVWDGTFKQAWTNNPAFVTYGLCVEDRFGLGKRIKSWMVDKWEMYRIAQYCDQMVPDGVGGQEPRYLCDMNLQGRAEAWTLLRDLAAIYRGMVYWAHGSLFMQADMPRARDIDYVFTRANVIDGDFVYGGAERNTHYSRALVSYDNPANNYDTDVIPVTDNALQRRYRDRPVEISAIGCTRASEAQRRGKWALLSNSQDRTVTFKTGMEGRIPLPGYVIPVADELVAGRPNGGRISSAAGRVVTLDRDTPIKAGDRLILNLPNGTAQARTVQSVAGRAVTVTTAYSVQPEPELQWAIDYDDLAVQLFRVLKTVRTQEGEYEITALEFNPSKFAAIDTGAKLDERPISVIPVTTVQPPASVTLSSAHMIDQGIAVSTMTIAWPAVEGAVAYDVEWRKDNGNWIRLQRTGAASVDVVGIYAGAYLARVRAVSAFDITSIWKSSILTQLNGKEGLPPAVTFLNTESLLFGIKISWGFPVGAEDTQRTEIWYSEGTDLEAATKLADLAYPQQDYVMQGLRAGQRFFFWARLVDRTGNLGPFFPVAPTAISGIASADPSPILEQITGEILESHLGKELTDRIDLIDKDGPGSVNERLGEVRSELDEQISDVNNHVNEVQNELQQQIDTIADLADSMPYKPDQAYTTGQSVLGEDGRLYQAKVDVPAGNSPPSATYWTDIGQAVQAANGMAARVQTVETKVQTLEGTSTAQAQQITGLQSGLTTTNGNVAAAQQAAQDAATLAGGKGKVIVQSAAPAVADRLAQNLWIDTTGNANTPKRWSGTAWVAVTDKVATDAAAAAANALAVAQTKADASVVQSLTTRVTDAEGALSSQGQAITGLNNSLTTTNQNVTAAQQAAQAAATAAGAKGEVIYGSTAPSADKRLAQNLWIDTTGTANTPKRWNGSAWVAVTDKVATDAAAAAASALTQVATKADASTVQSLTNTVDQQGAAITATGQAITNINTSLNQIGSENLLYNPSFEAGSGAVADGWFGQGNASGRTYSLVASTLDPAGRAQRIDCTSLSTSAYAEIAPTAQYRVRISPGDTFTLSAHVRGTVGARYEIYVITYNSSMVGSGNKGGGGLLTDSWQRVTVTHTMPTTGAYMTVYLRIVGTASVSSGFVEFDRVQLEQGSVMSGWRDNNAVSDATIAANAAATTALTGRVAATEQGLTSASSQLTQLDNSIGDIGGENLLYNPSFVKVNTSDASVPDGWQREGAAVNNPSMVVSWLNPAERAFRSAVTGVTNTTPYLSLIPTAARRPAVGEGQVVTSSAYFRRMSDSGLLSARLYIQFLNAAGTVISTPSTVLTAISVGGVRVQLTATAPAGTVKAVTYFRIFAPTSAAVNGTFEIARPQLEYASRAGGWRDNGQVNAADNAATSAAVDGLSSQVSQQGGTLASVASRTTTLENAVNSTTNGLATKASASALDAVTNRVTAAEGALSSQSTRITELNNSVGEVQGALGSSGLDPAPDALWQFDSTTEGWVAAGATLAQGAGFIKITATSADPQLQSGTAATLSITGGLYSRIRARITRRAGAATDWDGQLFYQTAGHGFAGSYRAVAANPNLVVGQSAVVEWDMANLASGGTDWVDNTITRLRLDLGSTSGGVFDVDWIVVGRVGPSASSRAVSSLDSKVTQQGSDLSAQAQQLSGLQTSVGNNAASIQQVSQAQTTLNGKVNASYSVKLQVTAGGQYVAAGFGLGVENSGGVLQSTFAVMADKFAILNPAGNGFVSPFAVQGGQVFLNEAFISKATIVNGVVGQLLTSAAYSNFGEPILRLDFNGGQIIMVHPTRQATYTVINRDGIDIVVDGVRRVRMGVWG
ncbi:hypothetical protein KMS_R33650 [Pseudomonas sp. LRP2-20]|uniref:TipJ family phage tail tip protein n=1 Tax=Pseudomonas sp. LRP2-20 TaxID=2944234 RepID=UPI00218B9112|nr:DUF1983 domain-containing protein [Pseudomonas sp. LRP2-20]BDM23608.1 hypothetical protein KMS_R33650 [Pseudomonas sp. LRP2-20]